MIRRQFLCAGIALMISFILPLHSHSGAPWKDPSSHAVRFVSVGDGVRLEVLDWAVQGEQWCCWQEVETLRMSLTTSHLSSQLTITFTG